MDLKNKRIAIVADWFIDFGWAELVISHLLEIYPEADIYTSVCYMDHPMLEGRTVYTSWIQKIPFLNRRHKLAGILRPFAFRSFDLSGYDVILCSSSAESKQVAMGKWNQELYTRKPKVFVYCHTPTRYYWSHAKEYEDMMEFGWMNPLVKLVFRLMKWWMQKVDYAAAQRVDHFIANSENTRERIQKYYDRQSTVIYPGIEILRHCEERSNPDFWKQGIDWDIESHRNSTSPRNGKNNTEYYLGLGRCIPYKKFDLLVEAFNANGKRLILCTSTDTPLFRELKSRSKPNIEWKFSISNDDKNILMANAAVFLFPPEEDFGLVPVEAMMMWTPVIAYRKWGTLETIIEWESGIFFSPQTPEALNQAIEKFEKREWNRGKIQEHAGKFSKENFQKNILQFIEDHA